MDLSDSSDPSDSIGPEGLKRASEIPAEEDWQPIASVAPASEGKALLSPAELKWPHEWHTLAWQLASGLSQREAAASMGYDEFYISTLLRRQPDIMQKVEQIKKDHLSPNITQRFAKIAPKALDVFEEIIRNDGGNTKTSDRLHAAQWILEKQTGKPRSDIDNDGGFGLLQLLAALEGMKTAQRASAEAQTKGEQPIDVTPKEADPLDIWVQQHVPESRSEKAK